MRPIGLIAAMSQESDALLRFVKPWRRIAVGSLRGYSFSISEYSCILVTSGMGMRRAREATQALVESFSPSILISFGIAGAVEVDLEIGDVVLAKAYCQLKDGILSPLHPLEEMPEAAREAAAQSLSARGARLFSGEAITTSGSQTFEYKLSEMKHPVLEMETAGIAQVAMENGIPLFSFRAISDGPRTPIPVDLGEVMDEDANLRVSKLIKAVLRNPKILYLSRQMRRNTQLAAENAAAALVAALISMKFNKKQEKSNE